MIHGHVLRNLVVGVDGSPSAAVALTWAGDTVGPEGEIHAVATVSPATELMLDDALPESATYRGMVERKLLNTWTRPIRQRVGSVTAVALEGTAANVLRSAAISWRADAIVVGTHMAPTSMPKTMGSTIRHLLRDLPCPLIVVPSTTRGGIDSGGPLIVGIGHGDATTSAVEWAAQLADDRGMPLGLVRATGEGPVFQVDGLLDMVAFYIDPAQRRRWVHDDLLEAATLAQNASENDLKIAMSAVGGLPAARLVEESEAAAMLVIGQHRSTLTGGRHVVQPLRYSLTHARCPVAVVPVHGPVEPLDEPPVVEVEE